MTGNGGFVGRHFCSLYGGLPLADDQGAVDIQDARRVESAMDALKPEAVLHLAAQSSVVASFEDPSSTFSVNFIGTFNLLRALKRLQFQGVFLLASTADVYGKVPEADLPIKETQAIHPRSPYAVSKVAAEAICYQWSQTEKFRVIVARSFTQTGPGQERRFAIAGFAHQIAEIGTGRRAPTLVGGDLDVIRDISDVRDTVRAYWLLLERGVSGEAYNICSGHGHSLRSVVEEMLRISGVVAEIRTDPALLRPAEQRRMVGDAAKIHAITGWEPEIPFRTTLTDILQEARGRQ